MASYPTSDQARCRPPTGRVRDSSGVRWTFATRSGRSWRSASRRGRRRSTPRASTRGTCARLLAEQDILGLPFAEEYGGTGTGTLMLQMAVEEIAKACASSALILMIQELGTLPIQLFGSDEQRQRFLPRCASGEWSPAFALSEPEAGSDPGGDAHDRGPRRRRVGHQRHEELDHERRRSPTSTWSSPSPIARRRRITRVRRRERPAGLRRSASSSTSSASRARRPARRCSRTCACRPRT